MLTKYLMDIEEKWTGFHSFFNILFALDCFQSTRPLVLYTATEHQIICCPSIRPSPGLVTATEHQNAWAVRPSVLHTLVAVRPPVLHPLVSLVQQQNKKQLHVLNSVGVSLGRKFFFIPDEIRTPCSGLAVLPRQLDPAASIIIRGVRLQ